MKIALVHDYLAQDGGAERVLATLHEIWPQAPIFVLFHDKKKFPNFDKTTVHESFLRHFPFVKTHFQWYFPLMPGATERHNLEDFDIVISSTSAFAKGVLTSPSTLHISYCHTPTRFLWSDSHAYVSEGNYHPLVKLLLPRFISNLRLWDKMSADRVDHFLANSKTVQARIQKFYRRPSEVIHPPINLAAFQPSKQTGDYFVTGGRLVPYKATDIVVQAFNRLGYPLKIFGTGPELEKLKRSARPNITFLGRISDTEKADLLSRARAFIHPQIEDFGITPIETMASGRPVIAYGQGGATETILPGVTGTFFFEQNWESLVDTILKFDHEAWDPIAIRDHAEKFDASHFKTAIKSYVDNRYEEFKKGFEQPSLLTPVSALRTANSELRT